MPAPDDVTRWISGLAVGDQDAAQALWEQYFAKLMQYARRKLRSAPLRTFDEEDVALSAMFSFCRGMEAGRFERVEGRDDLWKLLVTITARKIYAQQRRAMTEKRGGGKVRGESVFQRYDSDGDMQTGMAAILGNEPTPELANMLVESTQQYLDCLDDENLRQIAQLKLEGWTNDEIAKRQSCVRRTVERKLERIREKWSKIGFNP